jgi:hypothetical protein
MRKESTLSPEGRNIRTNNNVMLMSRQVTWSGAMQHICTEPEKYFISLVTRQNKPRSHKDRLSRLEDEVGSEFSHIKVVMDTL